jgi:hypothetical protein
VPLAPNPLAVVPRIWGVTATDLSFDLDRYLRVSGATKPASFDWERPQPRLSSEALFCLAYMMDIESHTIVYLRELLSTKIVREVDVTAFLSCWAYEEFFHSLVLRRFLVRQGVEIDDRRFSELRRRRSLADQVIVPVARLVSRVTRHFPAVHMTWGAINEFSTLTGYEAVIRQTDPGAAGREPSLLTTILERIIKDERRHFAFYFNQARARLRPSAAHRLTSFLLRRFWTPVGVTVRGDESMRRVCAFMFPDDAGLSALDKLDSRIRVLPGLEWFDLGRRYAEGNGPRCFEGCPEEAAGRGAPRLRSVPLG